MDDTGEPVNPHEAPDPLPTMTAGGTQAGSAAETSEIPRGTPFGRYVVLSKLGAGGMGVVYAAYDQELDRKVALKLLHVEPTSAGSDSNASVRLLREAQAMARLAHPNVIAVHDVGASEGRLFMAMELVEGTTLKEWLKERPHSWRDVVGVFKAAGRGLAAAHAVGIVHRDFKPANVLIGKDGRPRVTDFGVARASGSAAELPDDTRLGPAQVTADLLATPLTQAGSSVGTPGYMAPEQYQGQPADARSDQFGFCVALYEALHGEPAFRGGLQEIAEQAISGKIPEPPKGSRVPGWVQRIVLRGLRKDPDERYPTMEALLDDLDLDRTARRRRWALGGGALLLVAALGVVYGAMAKRHGLVCRGAERKLAGIWDDPSKRAMAAAFRATGKSYAQDTLARVERVIDRYAGAWVAMHTEACEATRVRGEQSDELLSLRMSCLGQRLEELRALTELFLKADGKLVENASKAAQSLSPVADCGDAEALLSPVKLPADPLVRAKADEIRQDLAKAKALLIAGKYKQGIELTRPLVSAALGLGYKPLRAEALNILAQLENEAGDYEAAGRDLNAAMCAAEASRHDTVAAEAAAKLVFVVGYRQERVEEALELAHHAEALAERTGAGGPPEASYLLAVATVQAVHGRFSDALQGDERAIAIIEKAPERYGDRLGRALNNMGVHLQAAGRLEEAVDYYQRAVAFDEREHGPSHPILVFPLANLAETYRCLGRYRQGQPYAERALRIASTELGPEHPDAAWASYILGNTLAGQGLFEEAATRYQEALALLEKTVGPDHSWVADVACNLADARRGQGRLSEARRLYERSLSIYGKKPVPDATDDAYARAGLGQVFLRVGAVAKAVAILERATRAVERSPAYPLRRAEMRFALARALTEVGRDRDEALKLAAEARDIYAKTGADDQEKLLGEIDAWRAAHGN